LNRHHRRNPAKQEKENLIFNNTRFMPVPKLRDKKNHWAGFVNETLSRVEHLILMLNSALDISRFPYKQFVKKNT